MFLVVLLVAGSSYAIVVKKTRLGLDLAGGIELVYEAIPNEPGQKVKESDIAAAIETIRKRVDVVGATEPEIQRAGESQISVGLPDIEDPQRAARQVGSTAQLLFYKWEDNVIGERGQGNDRLDPNGASNKAIPTLEEAVKLAAKQKLANEPDDALKRSKFYMFLAAGKSEGPDFSREELLSKYDGEAPKGARIYEIPRGTIVVQERKDAAEAESRFDTTGFFVLKDNVALTGKDIDNPKQIVDPQQGPAVSFGFTGNGDDKFQKVTKELRDAGEAELVIGANKEQASHRFAVILDGEVVSLATISNTDPDLDDGISGGAQITGLTITEARELARFLEIGALPISLKLVSQTQVSATLGKQALDQGVKAGVGGIILVLAFLLVFYRLLGVIAGAALIIYALFFFALIELIPITLTLPGIAGLVLTLSVAADANIVIFERIKEEYRLGRSIPSAISTGYAKGFATILDANVVIVVTAFILFVLATAGVKGFALVLGIGTIVSLFTAVFATSAILGSIAKSSILEHPTLLGAGGKKVRWHFDFMGWSKWVFSLSGAILAIGGFAVAGLGLTLGIDFEAGTRVKMSFDRPATEVQVRDLLVKVGAGDAKLQRLDGDEQLGKNAFQISSANLTPQEVESLKSQFDKQFSIRGKGGDESFEVQSVGPTFGASIARSALIALVASLMAIGAYIALRFTSKFSVPVMIALAHDLLITVGVYALVGREVTGSTVAALLTILGFSLYDSIIVFDRIRENIPRMPRAAFSQIVNRSMSEVLTRSLATSFVTVLPILSLLFFGGETLQDFAFALLVGTISGTYSSIFIAAPVLTHWMEREPIYRQRRVRIAGDNNGVVPPFASDTIAGRAVGGAPGSRAAGDEATAKIAEIVSGEDLHEPGAENGGATPLADQPVPTAETTGQKTGRPTTRDERRAVRARRKHGRTR